ncbi:MAG: hypothetical protein ACKOT0_10680 [bacterium]
MNARAAGVALLRMAAVLLAALGVGMVLAVFSAGAQQSDEAAGLSTVQTAVLFFGPIAAVLTLAFIVVLALTRPASLAIPGRRRAARATCWTYAVLGVLAAVWLRTLSWALLLGLATTACAVAGWVFLRRAEELPGRPTRR